MKKCLPILFILALLALILQYVVNLFVNEKVSEYVLKTDDNSYSINESFRMVDDKSFYDFTIIDDNNDFYTFSFVGDFNRQNEVIRDVEFFTTKDLSCIFPIYKRNKYGDVSCLYKGEQVSYSYLKQLNNYDISMIIKKLESLKYDNIAWDDSSNSKEDISFESRNISVYKENIPDNYAFLMWGYKGLYILKNNSLLTKQFIQHEQYENVNSMLVGKYYVSVDATYSSKSVSEFYYYNVKELGKGTIPLLEPTSEYYYFNGVYDDKLYMTDTGKGKQFVIDPAFETVKEVGNKDSYFVGVKDNKLIEIEPSEFLSSHVYFNNSVENNKIVRKYGNVDIVKERSFYYFKTKDGKVYRAHENNVNKPVLLFKFNNLTEWKVKNGEILAIAGDTMYFYSDEFGLRPIAINNELKYNHNNIGEFWKK